MKSTLLPLLLLIPLVAGAQTYTFSTLVNLPSATSQGPVNPNGITIDDEGNLYATSNSGGVYR
jgi:hypothetical protein